MKNARYFGTIFFVALVAIMASFDRILNFVTDYLWFKEVGYTQVFLTKLMTQIKVGIPVFIIITLFMFIYLRSIKKNYYKKVDITHVGIEEKRITQIEIGASVLVGMIATVTVNSNLWFKILSFINASEFGIIDPIFKADLSFYMFRLPFVSDVYNLLIVFVLLLLAITVLFYVFLMSVRRPRLREVTKETEEGFSTPFNTPFNTNIDKDVGKELLKIGLRQITVLGVLFFIALGIGYFLRQYDLLYSTRGVAYGASYTDVNVTLLMYKALMVLAIVSAVLYGAGMLMNKYKMAFVGPVLMIIVALVGNGIALGVQSFIVAPDEISKEREYLEYNIEYTKMAYSLGQIEEKDFPAELNLTSADLENNAETIDNIRINDYRPTKQFYNQRQGIRPYYKFNDVDIDRYVVNGKYTQVFLSVREIDESLINTAWINQHLKYTHGYGLTLSPVNTITSIGQPELLIKGIPPESAIPEIKITRPEIYFGELTKNYIITNTDELEFDYPSGDSNAETTYEGDAGIELKGINKLLFAIKERSMKLLVSNNINSDSKIVLNRNIMTRVSKIAPFIYYDQDPYIVTTDEGRLVWVIDGYTTSSKYPYSEPYLDNDGNYLRNAVKVTVDAYDGKTTYYQIDEVDPVIETLGKIFPDLLKPMSEMPADIKAHIRYPQALFNVQANVYRAYHMNDINVFYQQEDLWDIANEIYESTQKVMEPSYIVMKLPEEEQEEFILSIPYTPRNKANMIALFVARNDGDEYGKLIVYKLPKKKTVYGPMQIESRIDQDTNISKEFSLWGQKGSTYIRGNLLTIPIEDSLIYVEPVYLKADNENSLPEVKRVIVVYGDNIAYEETLEEALVSLFGKANQTGEGEDPVVIIEGENADSYEELIKLANDSFENAETAQRNGDWSAYGRHIEELKLYLIQLEQLQSGETVEE